MTNEMQLGQIVYIRCVVQRRGKNLVVRPIADGVPDPDRWAWITDSDPRPHEMLDEGYLGRHLHRRYIVPSKGRRVLPTPPRVSKESPTGKPHTNMVRPRRASRRREETGPNAQHGVLPVTRRRILYKGGRVVLELLLAEYKGRVYPGHNFIVGMSGSSSGPCSLSESFHDEAAAVVVYRQSAISFVKYKLANSCTPKCDRVSLEKALEKLEEDERNATRGKEGGSRSGRSPAEAVEQYAEACRRDAEAGAGPTGVALVVEPQEAVADV